MLPEWFVFVTATVMAVVLMIGLVFLLCEGSPGGAIAAALALLIGIPLMVSECLSGGRVVVDKTTLYKIQNVDGSFDGSKVQIATVNGDVVNITGLFKIVLSDPDLYYYRIQTFKPDGKGWYLVEPSENPSHDIVLKSSTVESQDRQ